MRVYIQHFKNATHTHKWSRSQERLSVKERKETHTHSVISVWQFGCRLRNLHSVAFFPFTSTFHSPLFPWNESRFQNQNFEYHFDLKPTHPHTHNQSSKNLCKRPHFYSFICSQMLILRAIFFPSYPKCDLIIKVNFFYRNILFMDPKFNLLFSTNCRLRFRNQVQSCGDLNRRALTRTAIKWWWCVVSIYENLMHRTVEYKNLFV